MLDTDKLGETIAKANKNLVETLASHGLLRTQTPKLSKFSGDELKGNVSFEHWEYEIETLRKADTDSAIKEAITKSLKGSTAESLRSLGPLATVEQVFQSMKRKYGITASYNSLIRVLFLVTGRVRKGSSVCYQIEIILASIKWRFPTGFLVMQNLPWWEPGFSLVSKSRPGTPLDSDVVILPFPSLNSLGFPGKQKWKKGALVLG